MIRVLVAVAGSAGVSALALGQPFHRFLPEPLTQRAKEAVATSDGGFVAVGEQSSFITSFQQDFVVSKHAADGTLEWATRLGTQGIRDWGSGVTLAVDGGYIVTGKSLAFGPNVGVVAVKLSATGIVQWARAYGGSAESFVGPDYDNDVIVRTVNVGNLAYVLINSGEAPSFPETIRFGPRGAVAVCGHGQIIGLDASGAVLFNRAIRATHADVPGCLGFADVVPYVNSSGTTPVVELAVVGTLREDQFTPQGFAQNDQILFVRTNLNGQPIFGRVYGEATEPNSKFEPGELGRGICGIDGSGDLYLNSTSDRFFSSFVGGNAVVVRIDGVTGAPVWARAMRDISPSFSCIRSGTNGEATIAGTYNFGDGGRLARAFHVDAGGALKWYREYFGTYSTGFDGVIRRDAQIAGGGVWPVMVGSAFDFATTLDSDMYFAGAKNLPARGSTGCRDAELFDALDEPLMTVRPVTLFAETIPGFETWVPTQVFLAGPAPRLCAECIPDVDDGSGTGMPDGGVGIEDLLFYLQAFENGDPVADVDDGSGTGNPDGGIGIEDLLFYLAAFEAGC